MGIRLKLLGMILVFVVVLPTLGLSCSKGIVGVWEIQSGCGAVQITFNADGTGSTYGFIGSSNFTWRIEGNELIITEGMLNIKHIPFNLSDNALTLYTDEGTYTLTRIR